MKKIIAFLLLTALIFNINGNFIVFKIQQKRIKKEIKKQIKAGVSEDKLHIFTFTITEWKKLQWVEKGREFRLQGCMYDVVRTEKKGKIITAYCINDKEETILFARLDELVKKKMGAPSDTSNAPMQKLLKLIASTLYFYSEESPSFLTFCSQIAFHDKNPAYPTPYISIIPPPPNV